MRVLGLFFKSAAYADDLTGSGTIAQLKIWWDLVLNMDHFLAIMQNPQSRGLS